MRAAIVALLLLVSSAPALAQIPPTIYYDGTGAKIGAALRVQYPSGFTGTITAGKLVLSESTGITGGTFTLTSSLIFRDSSGGIAPIFAVTNNGNTVSYIDIRAGAGNGVLIKSPSGAGSIFCNDTAGCGVQYGSGSFKTDGLNFGMSTGNIYALAFWIFGDVAGNRPSCSSSIRGKYFYTQGVTGGGATTDKLELCMKAAADTYAWIQIVTGG